MRFFKFLGVGGAATLIQYALLFGMVEWLAVAPVAASVVSYCISAVFNYAMNYFFTFESNASHAKAAGRFVLVVVIGLLLNTLIMKLLVDALLFHYLFSQVCATGVVLIWNFAAHKYWTYKAS